jgi:hypothetical protein
MDIDSRKELLESAGLAVIDRAWAGSPEPMAAWRLLIAGGVVPTATVRIAEGGSHLPQVESKWEELAHEAGLLESGNGFLASVGGMDEVAASWALVRPNPPLALVYRLGPVYGQPEFVAMDVHGRNVRGHFRGI